MKPLVARFDRARFRWKGFPSVPYKATARGPMAWCGVERFVLVGGRDEPAVFQLRYFEIAPGGYSSLEQHRHAHAVLVLRGRGRVRIGTTEHRVGTMDFIFIPPGIPHQFRAGKEPFGFLCPVDAVRDRPKPVRTSVQKAVAAKRAEKRAPRRLARRATPRYD